MTQEELVLLALAASDGEPYSPVQIQKTLFVLQKAIPDAVGTPFHFEPYAYGPFAREVYGVVETLKSKGDVEVLQSPRHRWSEYRATQSGMVKGKDLLRPMEKESAVFVQGLSAFVRGLSFADLLAVIYKEYPDMAVNSVFSG
ncbi:MAG TPA: hypothetical protein VM492_10690 [Sumerlaeia bacterium]|nr:hypothetical protein [Sumerlaeia bacterium]